MMTQRSLAWNIVRLSLEPPMQRHPSGYQRVGPLALVPSTLAEFGVAAKDVLSTCGLPDDALNDPEGGLPYDKLGDLFEACVKATGCPHFGVLIGQKTTWANIGPVGALFRNAPTLGDALRDVIANHNRYVEGGMIYLFPMKEEVLLGYAVYQSGVSRFTALLTDVVISAACQIIRMLSGVSPIEVLLARGVPNHTSAYANHYRVPVRFNADMSGLVLSRSTLESPILGGDPVARKVLQERVNNYWAAGSPSIVSQTRRMIFPNLLAGDLTLSNIAQTLSMSPRTLNRRLKAEGTSFKAEVERLRHELAMQLLANTTIPITHVSVAFGYSTTSVFTRSFRRWSGGAPSEWRQRNRS